MRDGGLVVVITGHDFWVLTMHGGTMYGTHVNRHTAREYGTMDATTNGIYAYQHNVKCLDCGHTPGDVPDCPCCDTAAMTVTAPTHRNDGYDHLRESADTDPRYARYVRD